MGCDLPSLDCDKRARVQFVFESGQHTCHQRDESGAVHALDSQTDNRRTASSRDGQKRMEVRIEGKDDGRMFSCPLENSGVISFARADFGDVVALKSKLPKGECRVERNTLA